MWRQTILFFIDTFAEDDAILFDYDTNELFKALRALASADSWDFLQTLPAARPHSNFRSIDECQMNGAILHCRQRHSCSLYPDNLADTVTFYMLSVAEDVSET